MLSCGVRDVGTRRSWIQRTRDSALQASPPAVPITAAEAQIVADADPIALRALLLPNYDSVTKTFSKLLLRVVRRCKWDGQVEGRVLHACEALGVREGRPMLVGALAKRLRGFGLAWHSFTIEECQAFVEQELDTDEDGRVGVPDIFAFLGTLQPPHQTRQAFRIAATRSSRSRTTLRSDIRPGVRRSRETRWQAAAAAGLFATRSFPRGLQQKLLTAAGQARSCGVNVLKALQESVCRSSFSSSSSRPPLGAEATHFFFRDIGADYEDFSGSNSSRSSLMTKSSSGQGMDLAQSEGLDGTLYRRSGWNERDVRIRINQSSREQNMFSGSPGKPFSRGRTRAEEPWSPPSDECQSHGGAGRRDERSRAQRDAPAASVLRHPPDPTSRSRGYRTQTLESKRLQVDFSHRVPEQEGRFKEGAVDAGKAGHDGPPKESGICISQRLQRAAEDLKRMQAEYAALEQQVRGGETEAGSMGRRPPPIPNTAKTNEDSDENVTIPAITNNDSKTSLPCSHRPRSSFCHGHSNPRQEGAYHHFFRRRHGEKHLPRASREFEESRGSGRRGKEGRIINEEEEDDHVHQYLSERPLRDGDRGRKQDFFSSWLRASCSSTSPPSPPVGPKSAPAATAYATALSSSVAPARDEAANSRLRIPPFVSWPQHAPDTRRCRALLLMAAQGKTGREEVFDPATARNGYSRIQQHQAFGFGEEKGVRALKPGHRDRDAVSARNFGQGRATDGDRGRPSRRGCRTPAMTPGVHPFLCSAEAGRQSIDRSNMASEEGTTRVYRDRTPERRPARPPAIKSPMYARCRSEERNVWDKASGRWKRSRPKQDYRCVRGHSADSSTRTRRPRGATPARERVGVVRY